jgi:tetratricopeptide (TPR) repeat protein
VKRILMVGILGAACWAAAIQPPSFDQGVLAYKEHRWSDAISAFIETLRLDPENAAAHKYLDTIAQEMKMDHARVVQESRLAYLQGASAALGPQRSKGLLHDALDAELNTEDRQHETQWRDWLAEAKLHKELGHLLPANELVLKVLSENPNHQDALRELSDLQSRLHDALATGLNLTLEERFAGEGFYAYGQADFAGAVAAWDKADALVRQAGSAKDQASHRTVLHYTAFQTLARAKLEEERHQAELLALFNRGITAYDAHRFEEALETFRKLAVREPDYPRLAFYLIQSENSAERQRAERLGEQRQKQINSLYDEGLAALEKEKFGDAERLFTEILVMDPNYTRAKSYLAMARAENQRRHDPKAAQMHYEAGLIAYASGKLDEAVREWNTALRMNPAHEKARIALSKVQKEMALYREAPDGQ